MNGTRFVDQHGRVVYQDIAASQPPVQPRRQLRSAVLIGDVQLAYRDPVGEVAEQVERGPATVQRSRRHDHAQALLGERPHDGKTETAITTSYHRHAVIGSCCAQPVRRTRFGAGVVRGAAPKGHKSGRSRRIKPAPSPAEPAPPEDPAPEAPPTGSGG